MTIDQDAERAVTGAILLDPDRLEDVRNWLEPQDFGGTAERVVYEKMTVMAHDARAITPGALSKSLLERKEYRHVPADAPLLS